MGGARILPRMRHAVGNGDSDGFGVMIGSLDHPEVFPPKSHSGIESQVPLLKIDDGLPRWTTEDDPYFIAATKATGEDAS